MAWHWTNAHYTDTLAESLVLASIHSALVSTSCWLECVHIVYTTPVQFKCWPVSYTMARRRINVRYTDTLPGQWWACVA